MRLTITGVRNSATMTGFQLYAAEPLLTFNHTPDVPPFTPLIARLKLSADPIQWHSGADSAVLDSTILGNTTAAAFRISSGGKLEWGPRPRPALGTRDSGEAGPTP